MYIIKTLNINLSFFPQSPFYTIFVMHTLIIITSLTIEPELTMFPAKVNDGRTWYICGCSVDIHNCISLNIDRLDYFISFIAHMTINATTIITCMCANFHSFRQCSQSFVKI